MSIELLGGLFDCFRLRPSRRGYTARYAGGISRRRDRLCGIKRNGLQAGAVGASEFLAAWLGSPQYQRYQASADYRRLQAVLEIAERQLGWDAWTTATKLLGGTVAVGVYPKEGSQRPDVLVIIRPSEAAALAELREQLDPVLVLAEEQIRRTESVGGIETLAFPKDAAFIAWKREWLAISTNRALLDETLRPLGGAGDEKVTSLDADDSYQKMAKSIDWDLPGGSSDQERILRAYVNTALLNKATGGKPIPEKLDNALGSLLFGDMVDSLRTSPFAAATVDLSADGLLISAALARDGASPMMHTRLLCRPTAVVCRRRRAFGI